MSILDRFALSRHLDDGALARIWSSDAAADDRTREHAHLAACAQCQARYATFQNWLSEVRDQGVSEANETFPPERLAAQQTGILRRLEALERPARVIAFPRLGRPAAVSHGGRQRWIAAAAAAGLVVGLAAGQLLDIRRTLNRSATVHELDVAHKGARSPVQPVSATLLGNDDSILIYDVATAPNIPELQPLDAITPRMRDVDLQSR